MNTDMEFKEILAEFLLLKGLSQTAFAKIVGTKQGLVSEWLKGKAKPGYDSLRQFCIAFDVSADYFLGLKDSF